MEQTSSNDKARTLGFDVEMKGRKLSGRTAAWMIAGLVVATAALVVWSTKKESAAYVYKTKPARRGDITVTVSATGTLQPLNVVDVGSELSGIIRVVEVDYNDRVTKGQVLARLDTEKLEAKVRQSRAALDTARAKLTQAEASLREAQSDLSRLRRLHELTGGKSPSEGDLESAEVALEKAKADVDLAKAQVMQAQATLTADEADLSKALIRSPINGIVLKRSVEPGQTVAASLQAPVLFTLAEDLSKMELLADVDEADIGEVREGQTATFTVDAYPDKRFTARVEQVRYGAQTSGSVVTYQAVLSLDNKNLLLRPGMTATADIVVRQVNNALLVPNEALRFTPPESTRGTDAATTPNTSLISKLFPRPPREERKPPTTVKGNARTVWTIRNEALAPIQIVIGASDGTMTEVISGNLAPGTPLVVDASGQKE